MQSWRSFVTLPSQTVRKPCASLGYPPPGGGWGAGCPSRWLSPPGDRFAPAGTALPPAAGHWPQRQWPVAPRRNPAGFRTASQRPQRRRAQRPVTPEQLGAEGRRGDHMSRPPQRTGRSDRACSYSHRRGDHMSRRPQRPVAPEQLGAEGRWGDCMSRPPHREHAGDRPRPRVHRIAAYENSGMISSPQRRTCSRISSWSCRPTR